MRWEFSCHFLILYFLVHVKHCFIFWALPFVIKVIHSSGVGLVVEEFFFPPKKLSILSKNWVCRWEKFSLKASASCLCLRRPSSTLWRWSLVCSFSCSASSLSFFKDWSRTASNVSLSWVKEALKWVAWWLNRFTNHKKVMTVRLTRIQWGEVLYVLRSSLKLPLWIETLFSYSLIKKQVLFLWTLYSELETAFC